MSKKLHAKYSTPKNGLHIQFSNVNAAFFLMWNDKILMINSDKEAVMAEYNRLQGEPAWVEVRGHYPEDSDEIGRRIQNLLGGYFHEYHGIAVEKVQRQGRLETILKVHFVKRMPPDETHKLLGDIESAVLTAFAPANKILASIEIP